MHNFPADLPLILNEAGDIISKIPWPDEVPGMRYPIIDELHGFAMMVEESLRPMGENLNGEDDDHPLWGINAQLTGLLEGEGASEDHRDVLAFIRATGLPESTVNRLHRALVNGERKVLLPDRVVSEIEVLTFAESQWGVKSFDGVLLKACAELGEAADEVIKIGENRSTFEKADMEVGDVLICLSQYAAKRGTTLEALRARAFDKIQARAGRHNWSIEGFSQAEERLHRQPSPLHNPAFAAPYGQGEPPTLQDKPDAILLPREDIMPMMELLWGHMPTDPTQQVAIGDFLAKYPDLHPLNRPLPSHTPNQCGECGGSIGIPEGHTAGCKFRDVPF